MFLTASIPLPGTRWDCQMRTRPPQELCEGMCLLFQHSGGGGAGGGGDLESVPQAGRYICRICCSNFLCSLAHSLFFPFFLSLFSLFSCASAFSPPAPSQPVQVRVRLELCYEGRGPPLFYSTRANARVRSRAHTHTHTRMQDPPLIPISQRTLLSLPPSLSSLVLSRRGRAVCRRCTRRSPSSNSIFSLIFSLLLSPALSLSLSQAEGSMQEVHAELVEAKSMASLLWSCVTGGGSVLTSQGGCGGRGGRGCLRTARVGRRWAGLAAGRAGGGLVGWQPAGTPIGRMQAYYQAIKCLHECTNVGIAGMDLAG